jgi:spore coat polysaccharide biosynthesis predicted glycosyltransferase SpsG
LQSIAAREDRSVANMASQMREADLIFTSAGRTTFEIACVGTPAIVIAQN